MRIGFLLLTMLAAVALCKSSPGASIGAPASPAVTVTGAEITLADLQAVMKVDAKFLAKLGATVVAAAPLPGRSRLVTREEILLHLRQRDANAVKIVLTCPETILVTRGSALVTGPEIAAAGEQRLREQTPAQPGEELVITPVSTPRDLTVPVGRVTILAEVSSALRSQAAVTVAVLVDGKTCQRTVVSYRLQLLAEVVVTSHDIARKALLSPAEVKLERRDLLIIRGTPLRRTEEVAGLRATLRLAAGTPISDACTEPAPLVLKGQEVTVTVIGDGVVVTAPAVAQEDGSKEQMIRVHTLLSKEDFPAKVVGEGRVEVQLTSQRSADQ